MKVFNMVRFTKEGKGVDKNAPPKKPLFRFLDILWRKLFKLIRLNILFFVFNILAIVIIYFITLLPLYVLQILLKDGLKVSDNMTFLMQVFLFTVIFFTSVPLFTVGPAQAGFTYVLRCFAKEEHSFIWSDFIEKAKENLKLSIKVCILDFIVGMILMVDVAVYLAISTNPVAMLTKIPNAFIIIAAVIVFFFATFYMAMHLYIYPMMVTFKINFRQLMKNSALFALIRWLPNMGILLFEALIVFIPIFFIKYPYSLIIPATVYIFFTPAFIGLINNFFVYPSLKKYMIDTTGTKSKEEVIDETAALGGRFVNGVFISDDVNEVDK